MIFQKEPVTCEKPLVAAGVESGSGGRTMVYLVFLHLPSVLLHYGLVSWSNLAYDLIAIYKLNDANPLSNEGEMRRMNFEEDRKSVV